MALALTRYDGQRPFYSKAIYRWNEVFLTHREALLSASGEERSHYAKFRLWLDTNSAYYGLYVEHQPLQEGQPFDWQRLMHALQEQPGLHDIIVQAEARYGAQLRLRTHENFDQEGEPLHSSEAIAKRLSRFYDVPNDAWAGFLVVAGLPKLEAVARGSVLAGDIARFLSALMPLYDAAVS